MKPTRKTQPYRALSSREQSPQLAAMLKGRGVMGNPMDVQRQAQKGGRKRSLGEYLLLLRS